MKAPLALLILCFAGLISFLPAGEPSITIDLHKDGTLAVESSNGPLVAPPAPRIFYTILSEATGRALAVSLANTVRGEVVIDWTSTRGLEQQWELIPAGRGEFHLVARHSGHYLAIREGGQDNGDDAIQWTASGTGHYLAIREGGQDNGDDAIQWTASGTAEQLWRIERSSDGCFRIVASHSGKSLATTSEPGGRGAGIVQESNQDEPRQKWRLQVADLVVAEPELSVSF
jgi:hypothetical protein